MAIYSLSSSVFSRTNGHRATAAAAYRAGVELDDDVVGERYDYRRKRGIEHSEIMTPEGAPEWMHNRQALWNAVERQENRSNSQTAREVLVALPHELDDEQRLGLVRGFVQEQFVDAGMVADFSIHEPSRGGDERNHHAHIMLTMRRIDGDGFAAKKAREWNRTEQLEQWRGAWADHCNTALEEAGYDERISHLSLEDQGIERDPTDHMGKAATAAKRRGRSSERSERLDEERRQLDAMVDELARLDAEIAARQQAELDEQYGPADADDLADARTAEPYSTRPLVAQELGEMQEAVVPEEAPYSAEAAARPEIEAVQVAGETSAGARWWSELRTAFDHYRETTAEYFRQVRDSWRDIIRDERGSHEDRDPPDHSR